MTVEERLIEKSFYDTAHFSGDTLKVILLSDAIGITKDLFTKEQVEELLKEQREICARELIYFFKDNGENWNNETDIIRNAPSPSLEGGEK